ncbi:MAG: hypothetical protein KAJ19_16160 [Gammaproteobacteria bacterium]|nr:hypothetical protein [Gammaproteobacteria bacterium]
MPEPKDDLIIVSREELYDIVKTAYVDVIREKEEKADAVWKREIEHMANLETPDEYKERIKRAKKLAKKEAKRAKTT